MRNDRLTLDRWASFRNRQELGNIFRWGNRLARMIVAVHLCLTPGWGEFLDNWGLYYRLYAKLTKIAVWHAKT